MKSVMVTEFVPPHGKSHLKTVKVSHAAHRKMEELERYGFRLTSELLSTGQISICIEGAHCDVSMKLCRYSRRAERDTVDAILLEADPIALIRMDEAAGTDDAA